MVGYVVGYFQVMVAWRGVVGYVIDYVKGIAVWCGMVGYVVGYVPCWLPDRLLEVLRSLGL